jgi:hypothetical protein
MLLLRRSVYLFEGLDAHSAAGAFFEFPQDFQPENTYTPAVEKNTGAHPEETESARSIPVV